MPKPTKGPRLGGGPAHERLLLANLAAALFTHKSIKTTETKAKRLRPVAERLITFAKRGDLHARRRVLSVIADKTVVHELFTQIAPQVENRAGGYTRITKLGFRKGDNASMVQIELVLEPVTPKTRASRRTGAAAVAAPASADTVPAASDEVSTGEAATDEVSTGEAVTEAPADEAATDVTALSDGSVAEAPDAETTGTPATETGADATVGSDTPDVDEQTGGATPAAVAAPADASEADPAK